MGSMGGAMRGGLSAAQSRSELIESQNDLEWARHLGISVTVAQVTLTHLVKVQILDPQFSSKTHSGGCSERRTDPAVMSHETHASPVGG